MSRCVCVNVYDFIRNEIYLYGRPLSAAGLVLSTVCSTKFPLLWAVKKHRCHHRWSQVWWSCHSDRTKQWYGKCRCRLSYFFPHSCLQMSLSGLCICLDSTHVISSFPLLRAGQLIFWSYPDRDTSRSQGLPCYLGFYIYYKPRSRCHMGIKAASPSLIKINDFWSFLLKD